MRLSWYPLRDSADDDDEYDIFENEDEEMLAADDRTYDAFYREWLLYVREYDDGRPLY